MSVARSIVAGGIAMAVLATATPSHAVYQRVETWEAQYAIVYASDCTPQSDQCTEIDVEFGLDESSAIRPFAMVTVWAIDLTGEGTWALVKSGSWYDASFNAFISANRKTATFTGTVDLGTLPCDENTYECTGPTESPLVQVAATASTSKSGTIQKLSFTFPPCTISRSGSYQLRKSKTAVVQLNGTDSYPAIPVVGSVVIEKDKLKLTSKGCLGVDTNDTQAVIQQHLAKQFAAVRYHNHKLMRPKTHK